MILPAQKAALLHIVPRADAYRHIKEGYFGTVVMCDDDAINDLDLAHRFSHQELSLIHISAAAGWSTPA